MSNEIYSKICSASLIAETTINTPLTPTTFFNLTSDGLAGGYEPTFTSPIKNNRSKRIKAVNAMLPPHDGTIQIDVEPKRFGHFLDSLCAGLSSGNYVTIATPSAAFTNGETIYGQKRDITVFADAGGGKVTVTSAGHGLSDGDTVVIIGTTNYNGTFVISDKTDDTFAITDTWVSDDGTGTWSKWSAVLEHYGTTFMILTSIVGTPTTGETMVGATSASTATLSTYYATAYGHVGTLPSAVSNSYTLQVNFLEHAIRYCGVRFYGIDSLAQNENVITAGIKAMAQTQFRHGYITEIVSDGAGAKTITMDQTKGLVASDSIKVYRAGTGFLDFSASGVKTHTVGTVASATTITVTNLQTALAVGDLIVLAPQTASYSLSNEFFWIGGTTAKVGPDTDNLAVACVEDFSLVFNHELEAFHCANGVDFENRFPAHLAVKGYEGSGSITTRFRDESLYSKLRKNIAQALELDSIGDTIGGTITEKLRVRLPEVQFMNYETGIGEDEVIPQEIPFNTLYNESAGHEAEILLVNNVASY